ncbi:hypothetical protein G3M48_003383 [Beauveria asiatica]|uniref:Uncharacterized protein n=1 Tax=Beauveria asiatica TaxID=1069075 RepID=A0AAW0RVK4_9HYPO
MPPPSPKSERRKTPTVAVKAATGLPPRDSAGPPGGSEPPAGPPAGPSRGGYLSPAYGNLPVISESPSEFNTIVLKQLDTIVHSRGYKDADKFSGKRYCFLRTKPGDFLDRCQRANLHENDLGRAFPLMLTGIADDHNVHAVANRNMTYYEMINKLRD